MSQSKLRFSIEESVWLKKGQEVAEVLSMSLDPEISITEEANQVCIKGALILCGKYCTENKDDNQTGDHPFSDGASYRSLTQLNVSGDGVTELVHRFPVDITIPSYRVEDSSQVKVEVESFEYELPNSTCIEISASICIYGIKDEKQRQDNQPNEEFSFNHFHPEEAEIRAVHPEEKSDIFTPFQFEARQTPMNSNQQNELKSNFEKEILEVRAEKKTAFEFKPQFEATDDTTMDATFDTLKSIAFSNEDVRNTDDDDEDAGADAAYELVDEYSEQPRDEESLQHDQYESYEHSNEQPEHSYPSYQNPYQYQTNGYEPYPEQQAQEPQYNQVYHPQSNSYTGYNPQNYVQRPYNEPSYGEQEYQEESAYEEQNFHQTDENHHNQYVYDEHTEEYEQDSEQYESAQYEAVSANNREEEPRNENALYLTKMLSGNDDNFSRMKMYILQRGDSLEHICERYDISLNTLMRMNKIQQEELCEGQIIYIPVSSR
ncbi:LysM peptidoglycan-binding domain-containing protein [Bacillus sp. NEB1478]|uniref:LysM peptidoglycan-binding domain-containing protein n=1 Tax=Bacillus sp. NEB1478 TaxID=3073816 RepID=UPI002873E043|nr:LysM peptidoglycan-binding domain-containing protein [Bacillus sp. NEB1478]WNB93256.1 LysM peptidoglycan-binding domain-containing protein [Bacillus sp. NEB1478]